MATPQRAAPRPLIDKGSVMMSTSWARCSRAAGPHATRKVRVRCPFRPNLAGNPNLAGKRCTRVVWGPEAEMGRGFVLVMDSFGIGTAADAEAGDVGADTLG